MEFAEGISLSKHSDHSSLNNGLHLSKALSIVETDKDSSENSNSNTETCDEKNPEKCTDVSKLEKHLQMSASNNSSVNLITCHTDQVTNGSHGTLKRSSDFDGLVTPASDVPANLGSRVIGSGGADEKLKTPEEVKNEDGDEKTAEDNWQSAASGRLVSLSSDSSADAADLEEEILARVAAMLGSSHKNSTSDLVNVHPMLDSGTVSQQGKADRVDDGEPVADPADNGEAAAATKISLVPISVDQKINDNDDQSADETLSDDSVICLDNDDEETIPKESSKAKESAHRRKSPVYIQIVKKQSSNVKLGSITSVCPVTLPYTAGPIAPSSSNASLRTSSLLHSSTRHVLSTPAPSRLMKSALPLTGSSNQPTLLDRNTCPRPMAKFLGDIGLQLVSRRVHENRIAQQKRKLRKSHGKESNSDALDKLLNLAVDPALTDHLHLKTQRCLCGFASESTNVLELHYESGRESCGLQHCCLCDEYSARYPGQFVRHMEVDHGRKVRVPPKPPTYLCQLCYFDTNGKAVYEKHTKVCQRQFVIRSNLKPGSSHSDIPFEEMEQRQTKPANCVVDLQPRGKAVPVQGEPVISKSALLAGELGPQQNLLRIGGQLFIVVSKPPENISSSSLSQTSASHLSLLHVDKCPVPATKTTIPTITMTKAIGQSTSRVQLTSQSTIKSSGVTPGLLATSVFPLSNKTVNNDNMWASKIAAAAAKSVISSCPPAVSKVLAQPSSLKASSTTVAKLLSTNEPNRSLSPSLCNSTTVAKLLLKTHSERLGHGGTMTCAVPSSSALPVTIPSRNSILLPMVRAASATTLTPALVPPILPKTIMPKCSSVARPFASNQPNGYVICPLCSGFIKDIQALDIHMRVAHKTGQDWASKLFRCEKCSPAKWYSSRDALFRHQISCHNVHRNNSQDYCCRCEQTGISDLIEHFKQKHNITLFSMFKSRYCSLCRMQLEGHRAFESHMTLSHKDLFPSLSCLQNKIRSSGPKNSCKLCHKDDIVNVIRHMQNRHQLTLNEMLRQVYCYFCSSRLQDALGFENHMLQVHKNVFSSRDILWEEIFVSRKTSGSSDATDGFCGTFKCSLCDDEFVSASYRYRHLVMSHPKQSLVCSLCRMSCGSKQCLMRHLKLRHTHSCSVRIQRLDRDTFEKHHCAEHSCSASSVDLCSSPETVVITDEDEDNTQEPVRKKPRLGSDRDSLGSRNIPPENIEEVLEIDGETVIIVQESDCC